MSQSPEPVNFYTVLQRRLHWLVLLLLALQYSLQVPMKAAMATIEQGQTLSFLQFLVTTAHTWGGISIAAIMIWRWQLRRRRVPPGAGNLTPMHERVVRWHHISLYVVLVLMASTGALFYFLELQQAAQWHEWGKWLLLVLVGAHIAGALSHAIRGDTVFQRMMGRGSLR